MTFEQAVKSKSQADIVQIAKLLQSLQAAHPGLSPKMAYDGAVKQGLTYDAFRKMVGDPVALSNLMFA
jgi:hypothetical protein